MSPGDLRDVGDGVRLLPLVKLRLQLINTNPDPSVKACRTPTTAENEGGGVHLLSGVVWMVQVDGDLSLTGAERIHGEHGRAQHPVSCRLDT